MTLGFKRDALALRDRSRGELSGGSPAVRAAIAGQRRGVRRMIEINLNGSYFMAQACGRTMRERVERLPRADDVPRAATAGWRGARARRCRALLRGDASTYMTGALLPVDGGLLTP
jgi:NAD(P)-dependent dehydrogenase (short-subunit alcohol dehydrogenase family)